jgi:hypothetical protein
VIGGDSVEAVDSMMPRLLVKPSRLLATNVEPMDDASARGNKKPPYDSMFTCIRDSTASV